MTLRFLASLLAGAIALAGLAGSPARAADERDIARILAGTAALVIIGKALQDSHKEDGKRKVVIDRSHPRLEQPPRHAHRDRAQRRHWDKRDRRHDWTRRDARALPGECLRIVQTRHGQQRLFSRHCLQREYRHVNRLPGQCHVRVRTEHGPRTGYAAACLRRSGYHLAGR
ncbi:MAG: hypothetical protein ACLFRU_00620 [Paracoccaceae bacterium]